MRITNKIIQNNNLSNINTNKIYQDRLSTQMSTQKKVNRPSDDPVVAIRALRLRSSVTEVTQYYSKNIPDAESWLNVTEDALNNLTQIITNMISQCTKGSNGDLTSSDRQIILEQLKALSEEVYSTGDADYAGRYVFTGYRTDTSLSFQDPQTLRYDITEQIDNTALESITKVNMGELLDINSSNYNRLNVTEDDISSVEVYRIQLSYEDCYGDADAAPSISFQVEDPATGQYNWEVWDVAGGEITIMHASDRNPDPYTQAANDPDAVIYVPETGEMLLGSNRYETLMAVKDNGTTVANEGEIRVSYQKENWVKGDLRPEHYFACEAGGIRYNADYLTGNAQRQNIEYDVGFNQTIQVNSTADECFQHGIGRTADDLVNAMQEVVDIETLITELETLKESATGADAERLQTQLDAANKALTLSRDKCQRLFEKGITVFQGYLNDANLSITDCGTRSSKLELIDNRMQNQKTTFETLKSQNEDVDITEVIIQLTSAELTYQAALMATGKVTQNTLLNFI